MEAAGAAAADDAGVPSEQQQQPDHEAGAKAEEEEGECPFCLYMKAGPCGKEFGEWEQCVEEAEKGTDEVVVRCRSITQSLMKCMEGFTDYYGLVLQAGEKLGQQEGNVVERTEAQDGSNSSSHRDNSTEKDQKDGSTEKDQNPDNTEKDQKADSTEKDQKAGLQVQIQVEDRKELAA